MTAAAAHAAIRAMRAKGIDPSDILDVVDAILAADDRDPVAERRRAFDRDRKARKAAEARFSGGIPVEAPPLERPSELNSKPTEFNQNPHPPISPRPDAGETLLLEAGVQSETIREWKQTRKAKRAGPITPLVAKGQIREAAAAGWTVEAATLVCIERGWQAFRAEYVNGNRQTGPPRPAVPKAHEQAARLQLILNEAESVTADRERQADRTPVALLAQR